ncbi:Acetyl-CoA acetyltransferase [Piscirickettsia salmonis]|nr:Acetyl-CoA acetyltransferase [Piscirickettsia salmonis]
MRDVVIVAAGRTAIGAFGQSLETISATTLGSTVIKGLLEKIKLSASQVDEVILGQVLTAGSGQNPARQTALAAGLSENTPALTINKVCGSGLKSIQLAIQAIRCHDADVIIAGG